MADGISTANASAAASSTDIAAPCAQAVAAWLPAVLLALRRAILRASLGWTLALAGALLLALLGGHQQIVLYVLAAAGLSWLFLTARTSPAAPAR